MEEVTAPAVSQRWKLIRRRSLCVLEHPSLRGRVEIDLRHYLVLLILNRRFRADTASPPELRGFMTDGHIAAAYAILRAEEEIDLNVIRAYRSQINGLIHAALDVGQSPPPLFISKRKAGVRLADAIEIVVLKDEQPAEVSVPR